MLLQEVTEDFERQVLAVLIDRAGLKVTRPELIFELFGVVIPQANLASSTEDRRIRQAIENLQRREYPILSSSGQAGYILATDDQDLDVYVGEIVSRVSQLKEKAESLRKSRRWIRFIREYRENKPPAQMSMFVKPARLP
jgi:hypothetical protein